MPIPSKKWICHHLWWVVIYNPGHVCPHTLAAAIVVLQCCFLGYKQSLAFLGGIHTYKYKNPEEKWNGVWCCRFSHTPRAENPRFLVTFEVLRKSACKGENIIIFFFSQCQKNDVPKLLGLKKMMFWIIFSHKIWVTFKETNDIFKSFFFH